MQYGLNPSYSFFSIIGGSPAYFAIYNLVFGASYFIITEIALIVMATAFLAINSAWGPINRLNILIRMSLAVVLPLFTIQVLAVIMYISGSGFSFIWNNAGVNWSSGLLYASSMTSISQVSGAAPSYLSVMEFFFLSGYFLATTSLIVTLELRQALLIVLSILLPVFSILFAIPRVDEYAKRMWKLFVETAVFPFFTIIAVYFAIESSGNFLLQLAFLIFAASSPFVIVSSFRIFSSSSLLGLANGISMQDTISRVQGTATGIASLDVAGTIGSAAGMHMPVSGSGKGIDWSELYRRDLDYRKDF
ncbi:MAG: hypothetical protein ACP5OC_01585 [Thermoplasmata archaeon]